MQRPYLQTVARLPRAAADDMRALRSTIIALMGFLTLVDLFAAQAILPSLADKYGVTPAAMGFAVNASTLGMAVACLGVGLLSTRLDRRRGTWVSLVALAVPTALLAIAPSLLAFTVLRIVQGIFMASAFTLTMAYLAEHLGREGTAQALAAYVTGVVASNVVGRIVSASVADQLGLPANFLLLAALNLAGALLVISKLKTMSMMPRGDGMPAGDVARWARHLSDPGLRAGFSIGFLILFAFVGIFTYINFVLVQPPIGLKPMSLGLVYLVFLPSMVTTPLAGPIALRLGSGRASRLALTVAGAGMPLLLLPRLEAVIIGMVLVGVGTFFAQAVATGFIGRRATSDHAAASGLYLAAYYLGGVVGAWLLGLLFDHSGWAAVVAGVGVALTLAALASLWLGAADEGSA